MDVFWIVFSCFAISLMAGLLRYAVSAKREGALGVGCSFAYHLFVVLLLIEILRGLYV